MREKLLGDLEMVGSVNLKWKQRDMEVVGSVVENHDSDIASSWV